MTYDASNIFAKILRGEIPCHRVYEDEATLAFMDVMPQVDGHTLVIPRSPSRNLLDADPASFGPLMMAVQKVALAHLHRQTPGRPDLHAKLTPDYRLGCKRVLLSDDFYATMTLPHVELVTEPIDLVDGFVPIPTRPGIAPTPSPRRTSLFARHGGNACFASP